mmetsp:Transcript_77488/g.240019  ORF Transcript_77488/g.240019 Transcript_77488/m.240019 type:complete len:252 (-) Transcript_77488:2941-3696(-)
MPRDQAHRLLLAHRHGIVPEQPRRPLDGGDGRRLQDPERAVRLVRRRAVPLQRHHLLRAVRLHHAWRGEGLQDLLHAPQLPGRAVQGGHPPAQVQLWLPPEQQRGLPHVPRRRRLLGQQGWPAERDGCQLEGARPAVRVVRRHPLHLEQRLLVRAVRLRDERRGEGVQYLHRQAQLQLGRLQEQQAGGHDLRRVHALRAGLHPPGSQHPGAHRPLLGPGGPGGEGDDLPNAGYRRLQRAHRDEDLHEQSRR